MDDDREDMILTKEQKESLYSKNAIKRNGLASQFHRWPYGIIPFEIDVTVGMLAYFINLINYFICIKFLN